MISPWFALHHKKSIQKYQDTAARDPSQYHESHEYHEYHPGAPNISPKVGTCRPHGLQGSQQWWCYPCAWWWSRDRFETLWKSLKTYDVSGFPSFKIPPKTPMLTTNKPLNAWWVFSHQPPWRVTTRDTLKPTLQNFVLCFGSYKPSLLWDQ